MGITIYLNQMHMTTDIAVNQDTHRCPPFPQFNNRLQILLSLISTVFLPLTFLTGVFGMNFQLNAKSVSLSVHFLLNR